MSKIFLRKQFSNYLGENRAINDTIVQFIPDGPPPSPTPSNTPTPTPSITPTLTSTPTTTPTNTPSVTPTITPTKTTTPTPTLTPTPTSSPIPWTPASLSNLNDWWSTSFGVVLSGLNVDAWTGYNGKNFTPYNASNKAVYSASDINWNNQPSITINASNAGGEWGYKAPTNIVAPTLPISAFVIARNNTLIDETPLLMIWDNTGSVSRMASLWRTGGGNTLWGYTDGLPNLSYSTLSVSDAAPSYIFNELLYNPLLGTMDWFASNTSILGPTKKSVTGRTALALNEIQLGTYFGILGSLNFSVVEVIMVNGIVPPGELTQLQNYINTTYGI
jgi:hypothetical protein